MSIETFSLTVPEAQRGDFVARAARVVERAEASRASRTELELALGVLSVLCGGAKPTPEPTVSVE